MRLFHVKKPPAPGTARPVWPVCLIRPVRPPGLVRLLCLAFVAWPLLVAGCAGGEYRTGSGAPGYRDGLWEGSGPGYRGEIRVQVRIASGLIQEIGIAAHNEDPLTGGEAIGELLELVLDYQSTDLDAVSGASLSSSGFLAAVEDALSRAAAP
jgi:fumarate reductase flavoprotein subunit